MQLFKKLVRPGEKTHRHFAMERENRRIQIVEQQPTSSGFGGYQPLNFFQILSGSAEKSTVPESYYTQLSQINPRYNGSRTQANSVNSIEGLENGFGTLPVIDYQRAYFAYCDQVLDPYPVLNNVTQYNICRLLLCILIKMYFNVEFSALIFLNYGY